MVTVAVVELHVEICGGTAVEFVGGVDSLDLCGGDSRGVEVAFASDFVREGDNHPAEVGVGGGEGRRRRRELNFLNNLN